METIPLSKEEKAFIAKAKKIYSEKYKEQFESNYLGLVAAIEPDSGEAFIGKNREETYLKALLKHPNKLFYFVKIGFKGFKKRRGYK